MKICLYVFFQHFQFTMDAPAFSFYWSCCQFFKQLQLNLFPNIFVLRQPLICLKNIKWHGIGRVFVLLWNAIVEYIFMRLDEQ